MGAWNGAALGGAPSFNGGTITGALTVNSTITTTGAIGAGAASPGPFLYCKGTGDTNSYLRIDSADGAEQVIIGAVDGGAAAFFGTLSNHAFNMRTNNTSKWQLTTAGAFTTIGASAALTCSGTVTAGSSFAHTGSTLGVFGTTVSGLQTVTGSRSAIPALSSLLSALAKYGLITDSSS